jgi:hypothetical protein
MFWLDPDTDQVKVPDPTPLKIHRSNLAEKKNIFCSTFSESILIFQVNIQKLQYFVKTD